MVKTALSQKSNVGSNTGLVPGMIGDVRSSARPVHINERTDTLYSATRELCPAPVCTHLPRARGSFGNEPTELIFVRSKLQTTSTILPNPYLNPNS